MPTLEVDGKVMCQSNAIFRYIANELDLYGTSNMDKVMADQVCETLSENLEEVIQIMYVSQETEDKKVLNEKSTKYVQI